MDPTNRNRKMRLTTPLGDDALSINRLAGEEALSSLYQFDLRVQSPIHKQVNVYDLLGKDVRVDIELPSIDWAVAAVDGSLPELKTRRFCGIVKEVAERFEDDHFRYFELRIGPRLWLWEKKTDCRIFQEQTVPEILKTLLEGLNVKLNLHDQYHRLPYCVQYNETSFDFAARLMSEAGIFFYFEHQFDGQDDEERQRGERLVITDDVRSLPGIDIGGSESDADPKQPGSNGAGQKLPAQLTYDHREGGARDELRIKRWRKSQRIVSTKCTVRDHTFQLFGQSLEANEEVPESVKVAKDVHQLAPIDHDLEVFEFPGQYAKHFDGIASGGGERPDTLKGVFRHNGYTAKREIERHAAHSVRIEGGSDQPALTPGYKFTVLKDNVISGPYFVKKVAHEAELNADFRSGGATSELNYQNSFECQAEVQPYQPERRAAPPKIHGYQTATVVGPSDKEVFVDKFGRVKVQFHWDRVGENNADSSCWIRVAQVWAGNRWGAFFWPRIGHEVVVSFEDGDPDRPLIIGNVYNAKNMPPMPLPERSSSGGIKSCTIEGNPIENYSCVIFHDSPGQEYLQLHSETHECLTSETAKINYAYGPSISFRGHANNAFGSGSGGGPSTPVNASEELKAGETDEVDPLTALNEQVQAIIQSFSRAGSGSGGLVTSILEGKGTIPTRTDKAGEAAELTGVGNEVGELALITGNSSVTNLGAESRRILGFDQTVVADIESLIEIGIPAAILMKLGVDVGVWDRGGETRQTYGNEQKICYGHGTVVHRGSHTHVNQPGASLNPFAKPTFSMPQTKTTQLVVQILAALVLLWDVAAAIWIKCEMESPD